MTKFCYIPADGMIQFLYVQENHDLEGPPKMA